MSELVDGAPFGILRGASSRGAGMDVVAPHLVDPPARGDFAVVLGDGEALVLRIAGAYPTGSFAEASDRGADYLAQLARQPAQVPERVRELLLRFRVEVVPLGWLKLGEPWKFQAGVRAIQLFGQPVYRPSRKLLEFLVNAGLQDEAPEQIVRIGVLARGHEATDVPVNFSVKRLKGRRTFVFARAGYGKSNLTKLLLSRLYSAPPDVGLLIVDPEGEYAFAQRSESGGVIPGLVDHPLLRDRVKVFTDRRVGGASAGRVAGRMKVDVARMSPNEFVAAFVSGEKAGQVWTNYLRSCSDAAWSSLIGLLREQKYGATDADLSKILRLPANDKGKGNVSLAAIRNNVVPVLERLDGESSSLLDVCLRHLFGYGDTPPGVVVLDVSTLQSLDADALVRLVLHALFRHAVKAFTEGTERRRGVLLVLEEAQSIFGGRHLDDQDIYVRWAKEGRKYGLGAMLITQQPGAIAHELVSQGDNFFVMHLLAQRDLDVLGAANAHFTPEILEFVRDEPVKGNCYFWSAPDQPYVVAARLDNYDQQAPASEGAAPESPPRASYDERLTDAVVQAIATSSRVFAYGVATVDGAGVQDVVAVAGAYLAPSIPDAVSFQTERPDDWEERWETTCIREKALDAVLERSGLLVAPGRAVGMVEGRENRGMLLLRRSRIRELAQRLGVTLKSLRQDGLALSSAG